MRLRSAVAGIGIAALAVIGVNTPAHAAGWVDVGSYNSYKACIDAGQQYQREGWRYTCYHYWGNGGAEGLWELNIWE
jgi:hypothetical protein